MSKELIESKQFTKQETNRKEFKWFTPMTYRPFAEESIRNQLLRAVRS